MQPALVRAQAAAPTTRQSSLDAGLSLARDLVKKLERESELANIELQRLHLTIDECRAYRDKMRLVAPAEGAVLHFASAAKPLNLGGEQTLGQNYSVTIADYRRLLVFAELTQKQWEDLGGSEITKPLPPVTVSDRRSGQNPVRGKLTRIGVSFNQQGKIRVQAAVENIPKPDGRSWVYLSGQEVQLRID